MIVKVLEETSQPFLQAELDLLRKDGKRLCNDCDLTGMPVSNTNVTYPNAIYGHMDVEIRLGYQAGMINLLNESYGRLWLSAAHLLGDTVSYKQAEGLVLAAEAKTGLHLSRRTDLLTQQVLVFEKQICTTQQRQLNQQAVMKTAEQDLEEVFREIQEQQRVVTELKHEYQAKLRMERPTSQLALAWHRLAAIKRRQSHRKKDCGSSEVSPPNPAWVTVKSTGEGIAWIPTWRYNAIARGM